MLNTLHYARGSILVKYSLCRWASNELFLHEAVGKPVQSGADSHSSSDDVEVGTVQWFLQVLHGLCFPPSFKNEPPFFLYSDLHELGV